MPLYIVSMKEVWVQEVLIEADNEEDARDGVAAGEGDFIGLEKGEKIEPREGFEFSHTLDSSEWHVREG